jgi:selenocysteine-specific elongation factor
MPLIVGTAGHIDHGKTALVRALTGEDTDRLPEERARGISIDLGFASFETPDGRRAGIVDVPGHERFVRNMLAGAHAMDLVLFTVAADDGVMPQTEEHLDILHLLGVRRGIFVITKTDLVEAARVATVREEIEILALGTTLEAAPVIPVSTVTGDGLDALRAEIVRQLAEPAPSAWPGRFRLPVDRSFVARGHGIVVTGTAVAGDVGEGDVVRLWPGGATARVRGIETHGTPVVRAGRRQRIALNLAGVERADVTRGHVVCDPAIERPSDRLDAWVEVRPGTRRSVRHHARLRLYLGTAEALGRIVFLDRRARLEPGHGTWAQLILTGGIVAMRGDRFILRDETSRYTIGGGVVVHPCADRHAADDRIPQLLAALRDGDDSTAAASLLRLAPEFALTAPAVASALDLDAAAAAMALASADEVIALPSAGTPEAYTTAESWARFEGAVLACVREAHVRAPLSPGVEMERVRAKLPWEVSPRVFRWAVERLVAAGTLVRDDSLLRLVSHRVALEAGGRALGERLEGLLRDGGLTPPGLAEVQAATGASRAALLDVLRVLEQQGRVVRVADEAFYHPDAVAEGTRRIAAYCRTHGEITAAAYRDLIGGSRKIAIAFLDWCDRSGVTLRVGDARRLRR